MKKLLQLIVHAALLIFIFNNSYAQVGINTITPVSTLDINGNLSVKVVTLNGGPIGSATQINDGVYINLIPTFGNQEFIVPNAVLFPGRIYILRNISDTENALFYSFGGSFFNKSSKNITSLPLTLNFNAVGKSIIIVSDGQNWTYFD